MKIKRLILINLVLILLVIKLPLHKELEENKVAILNETNTEDIVETKEVKNIEITNSISSRSLNNSRIEPKNDEPATEVSEKVIEFIKKKESFKDKAYKNEGEEYWTIGYGHYGSDVKEGQTISEESAERLLLADINGTKEFVLNYCSYMNLNQAELDALVSFTYNLGPGNLQKLTANRTRTKAEIPDHITYYVERGSIYEKGLTQRRQEELNRFLGGEFTI